MDFIRGTLSSAAVSAALIAVLIWLARTWIKERLSHSIKHEYDLDLEQYKSDMSSSNSFAVEQFKTKIGTEYDVIKAGLLRYSEKQFDIYNELWASLCDLEVCVNALWQKANVTNLRKMAKQVHEARMKVKKSALLIEDRHYRELNLIMDEFEEFQFGKRHLIDLRKSRQNSDVNEIDIMYVISHNYEVKDKLVILLSEMMACLRKQIVISDEPNI